MKVAEERIGSISNNYIIDESNINDEDFMKYDKYIEKKVKRKKNRKLKDIKDESDNDVSEES